MLSNKNFFLSAGSFHAVYSCEGGMRLRVSASFSWLSSYADTVQNPPYSCGSFTASRALGADPGDSPAVRPSYASLDAAYQLAVPLFPSHAFQQGASRVDHCLYSGTRVRGHLNVVPVLYTCLRYSNPLVTTRAA